MMSRRLVFGFWFLVFGLFFMGSVLGLGVTPGRTTINFEPGLERTVNFEVVNTEGVDLNLRLSAQGDLAEYVTLSERSASILASEGSKTFSYVINLPSEMGPGLHTGEVTIEQASGDGDASGFSVVATVAVATQIHVYVPYPGKYADVDMVIYNANQGMDASFVFPVVSRGEMDLDSVVANVEIFNEAGSKVGEFSTDSIDVPAGQKREIVYNWKANVTIGNYYAEAVVVYDAGEVKLNGSFAVGSKELELKDISVNSFSLGEIAKLEMLVENKWSGKIGDAYIETNIKNDEGDVVSTFDSATYDIEALASRTFVAYWDTAGFKEGDYDTEVSINYMGQSSRKDLKFQVRKNELTIIGLGYVISSAGGGGNNNLVIFLIVIIVVLVLINVLWFFVFRKKIRK